MTRFWRYVVSSMECAKIQMIPSVTGIANAASMNGTTNASVPNTNARMSSAIGIAMYSSPIFRSCANTGSRSCSIAGLPDTQTCSASRPRTAARMSSV